ncbi:unnamed protein product [Echinostoma caproni]|uniref:Innexin n=1 Tax=Echinostoma caproni TaxID=27848 RepID=A0A183A7G6_9TREM|nr:unnamed protein product [Echinostoma caproni]
MAIVTVKQYLTSAIACYIPTVPSGSDFDKFLENYCWVHGTIPILAGEKIPQTLDEWAYFDGKHRINYYQWVPFVLGLQGLLFYIPRIVWQVICSHQAGTDLQHLIDVANQASKAGTDERKKLIAHVINSLDAMLFQHREFRAGTLTNVKRRMYKACGILVASKRLGTWLAFTYFVIKVLYLINAIGQLYMMQRFLGFNESMSNFGIELANYMAAGRNWDQTRIFPRISFCYLDDIRQLGSTNRYVAQCVLPVNMLNEKLYIFLWYWTAVVAIFTALSIPLWLIRLTIVRNRLNFIKKFLRLNDQFHKADKQLVDMFTKEFLRHDGVFLLRMLSINVGDVITSEVISELWQLYCNKYTTPLRSDDESSPPEPPSLRDRRATAPEPPHLGPTTYSSQTDTRNAMSATDFVGLYNKYRLANFIGVDDWADRLSYFYSFVLILACTFMVTSKTYLLRPIACHMPTAPDGANFKNYVESACWVLGTVPLRANETIPQQVSTWEELEKHRRINYYQWVPFMLALQAIMFYIPRLAWQSVSFNRLGTDLNQLVGKASEALMAPSDSKRTECIQQAARSLELLLFAHREYRHGILADLRRSMSGLIGFLFVSKRLGTWTVFAYFCIKLAYLGNALIQLYIMMIFLNYDRNMFLFAWKLLGNLLSETYWTESLYFPRISYCILRLRHLGARENMYTGVCALPINMFNEKIYIFLFFWIMVVMMCTALSPYHRGLEPDLKRPRRAQKAMDPLVRRNVEAFVNRFLRYDGVFLIHVMTANAGDVVTADIVALLWHAWTTRYAGRPEWEHPSDVSDSDTPQLEDIRTYTESIMSGRETETGNFPGLRKRPHEMRVAHQRRSLPYSFVKCNC